MKSWKKRLAILVCIGAIAVLLSFSYIHLFLSRPIGSGPAGPNVDRSAFGAIWSTRKILVLGIGDSITAGLGANSPDHSYFNRLVDVKFILLTSTTQLIAWATPRAFTYRIGSTVLLFIRNSMKLFDTAQSSGRMFMWFHCTKHFWGMVHIAVSFGESTIQAKTLVTGSSPT